MRQIPPDTAETVIASSVLVLAPHPDDEVLGCGGLLTQLADAGAAVRVLFLTDGSGAREEVADRAAYAARRRDEAAAVADLLGFAGIEHLAVADGSLGEHLEEAGAALRRALLSQRPDLLLVPSPLDVSRDHRAAFAAVHRLLSPLRTGGRGTATSDEAVERGEAEASGDPLAELAPTLRVLVYEINRPAYPDLLVDVSGEMERLERAMALYASQEERRGYWRACQGLRAYRALTLEGAGGASSDAADGASDERDAESGPAAEVSAPGAAPPRAAEGYRRLTVSDFTTRSLAQLVRELGGRADLHAVEEGPTLSVVVRTKDRPGLLAEALASLADSTWRRAEVVLVNDGGAPPEVPADFPLPVVRVDLPRNRGRAAAANAGVAAATGDYVCFLDDDDLVAPEHLETLAGLVAAADVDVAYTDAAVGVYALDPDPDRRDGEAGWRCVERRLPYSRDFDPDRLLVDNYIPFHTLIIERGLFDRVAPPAEGEGDAGPFDPSLPFFEDWDFLIRLAAVTPFHHHPQVTCEYRHFRGGGHHVLGGSPRSRADFLAMKARVVGRRLDSAGGPLDAERLARVVDELRAEAVSAEEAAASARREALDSRDQAVAAQRRVGELTLETLRLEDRWHSARGEAASLAGDRRRLEADVTRLYADEAALRRQVEDQDAHLGRTYAEIQRLEGLLEEMRRTRAWRLHSRLQRLKGGGAPPEEG